MLKLRGIWLGLLAVLMAAPVSSWAQDEDGDRRRGRRGERGDRGRDDRGGRGGFSRGGRGFGVTRVSLAAMEKVQKELKLSEEQVKAVGELNESFRKDSRELYSGSRDLSREEREKFMAEVRTKVEKLTAASDGKVAALLKEDQNKRLNEIYVQQRGVDGLTDKSIAAAIGLSQEQLKKIEAVRKANRDAQQKMFAEARESGGFGEIREKMTEMRKKSQTDVLAVLSDEQKKKFEAMKGAAFELDRRSRFGGGRGGGRRGGGEGGERRPRRRPDSDDAKDV